jgi:hypothetical protein
MLLVMATVACGGLDYLHRQQHQQQAAEWLAAIQKASGAKSNQTPAPLPVTRTTTDCLLCLILHSPLTSQTPQIAVTGLLFLAIVTRSPSRNLIPARLTDSLTCRGPPARQTA